MKTRDWYLNIIDQRIRSMKTASLQKSISSAKAVRLEAHAEMLDKCRSYLKSGGSIEEYLQHLDAAQKYISIDNGRNHDEFSKLKPYVNSGLPIEFAKAIVDGTSSEDVLGLYDSEWRRQYETSDPLIQSVLCGQIDLETAKTLNMMRSNHEDFVMTCINTPHMAEWAISLYLAGFSESPEGISNVLDGGDPATIARIRGIVVSESVLPPPISGKKPSAKTYIDAGLPERFAEALVNGVNSENVLSLWEAEWARQYRSDDRLIEAVLTGRFDFPTASKLNSIRSNHERLVHICIRAPTVVPWAISLHDSGFGQYPEAINDVLDGGDPKIIARLRDIQLSSPLPPTPPVATKIIGPNPPERRLWGPTNKQLETLKQIVETAGLDDFLLILNYLKQSEHSDYLVPRKDGSFSDVGFGFVSHIVSDFKNQKNKEKIRDNALTTYSHSLPHSTGPWYCFNCDVEVLDARMDYCHICGISKRKGAMP